MQSLSSADLVLLICIVFFVLRGAIRGFLRSLTDMLAGVFAVIAAYFFASPIAEKIHISAISLDTRKVIAVIFISLTVYIGVRWIGAAMRKGAELTMFGGIDRMIGAIFGAVQGATFVLIIFLMGYLTSDSESFIKWTRTGKIAPSFAKIASPVSEKTREYSQKTIRELMQKLLKLGVPASMMQKISDDPALLKEMIKQSKDKTVSAKTTTTKTDTYSKMYAITSNDSLSASEKAKRLWEVITSNQKPKESTQ